MQYRAWDQDSVFPSFSDPFFPAHLARYYFASKFLREKRVLDLGCGKGYGSNVIAQVAESVTAVDLNPDSIKFAKENYSRGNLNFELQDVHQTPHHLRNAFDAVISFEVLEHLHPNEASTFLGSLKLFLKPGGILILSTPNHDIVTKSGMPVPDFHINNLTAAELRGLLKTHFAKVEVFGQVVNRNPLELGMYYADVFNLRHSKTVKSLRRLSSNSASTSTPASANRNPLWTPAMGPGPAANFHFSKLLWRQAGMTFTISHD